MVLNRCSAAALESAATESGMAFAGSPWFGGADASFSSLAAGVGSTDGVAVSEAALRGWTAALAVSFAALIAD